MKQSFFRTFIFFISAVLISGVAIAEGPELGNFSADMVMKSEGQNMQAKLYVSQSKMRMETQGNIIITRLDKNISLILMPAQGMYMEQAIDPMMTPKTSRELPGETERTPLGTESVGGKTAKKFKVTYMENGRQTSVYQWIADDMSMPVKVEAIDGSWSMEYQNINIGQQPDSLFETPSEYRKFEVPSMGGALGQGFGTNE